MSDSLPTTMPLATRINHAMNDRADCLARAHGAANLAIRSMQSNDFVDAIRCTRQATELLERASRKADLVEKLLAEIPVEVGPAKAVPS
jgi:hypothetical protein